MTVCAPKEAQKTNSASAENASLRFVKIGVWTVMTEQNTTSALSHISGWTHSQGFKQVKAFSHVAKFLLECYQVAPLLMIAYVFSSVWQATESAVKLYFSSRFLSLMQAAISTGKMDGYELSQAVALRLAVMLMDVSMNFLEHRVLVSLSLRIRYFFEARAIEASLRLDLNASQTPEISEKLKIFMGQQCAHESCWNIFENLFEKLTQITSVLLQIAVLFALVRSQAGGEWFTLICLLSSVAEVMSHSWFSYRQDFYVWASNAFYSRMQSLVALLREDKHRVEVISDTLSDYIKSEWRRARNALGDTSDLGPQSLQYYQQPISLLFSAHFVSELPLMFHAYQMFCSPASFSLTSIALTEQTMRSLTWSLRSLVSSGRSFLSLVQQIEDMYNIHNYSVKNLIVDGNLLYPRDGANTLCPGMSLQFNNVSFTYPRSDQPALKNLSFSIKAGQVVVIVGSNGSGKSTLLKLLNRLFDPTSGVIEIDGKPLPTYKADDVRRAMAILYQTYTHYPLSIGENILLGQPDLAVSQSCGDTSKTYEGAIEEAAKQGGSFEFVKDKTKGFDTVLHPKVISMAGFHPNPTPAFVSKKNEISKVTEVSAGQWQRLALSRLFFRAASKHIKLVAADEPSASLDPKMENDLFERLRSLSTSEGRTMIYVTHRFGYLTKHADLILVLQKGNLVEQGKHCDLLSKDGEYAKLYKLQAEAFLD